MNIFAWIAKTARRLLGIERTAASIIKPLTKIYNQLHDHANELASEAADHVAQAAELTKAAAAKRVDADRARALAAKLPSL